MHGLVQISCLLASRRNLQHHSGLGLPMVAAQISLPHLSFHCSGFQVRGFQPFRAGFQSYNSGPGAHRRLLLQSSGCMLQHPTASNHTPTHTHTPTRTRMHTPTPTPTPTHNPDRSCAHLESAWCSSPTLPNAGQCVCVCVCVCVGVGVGGVAGWKGTLDERSGRTKIAIE